MVNRKVVEVLYGGFKNSTQAQKFLQQAGKTIKSAKKDANKFINSIFTEGMRGTKNGVKALAAPLGIIVPAGFTSNYNNLNNAVGKFFLDLTTKNAQVANKVMENPNDLLDTLTAFIPVGLAVPIISKAKAVFSKSGAKAAQKYVVDAATKARQLLVKQSKSAKEKITKGSTLLKGSIDEAISKLKTFSASGKSVEEIKLAQAVKNNATKLKRLADELNIKKASEIPNMLKFVNQLGDIIKNSPKHIKSLATGAGKFGIIGNVGLSTYDLWQAFKDNDNSLLPKSIANAGRIGASLIPGNTILKLLYGGLGYVAGDKLAKAALEKLGVNRETTPEQENEYETGIAYPDLSSYVPEYLTGASGRKYHVVNEKIYDFATGKPVNVNEALTDADNYITMQTKKNEDSLANVNSQIEQLAQMEQRGYNVPMEAKAQLYNERDNLLAQVQKTQNRYNITDQYDSSGDLVEQYRQREVIPVQQQQVQSQQQYMNNISNAYSQIFGKIANDTFADLDNYYTPENQAIDYFKYMQQYQQNQVPYLSPEEFSRVSKVKAMQQLAPTIREKALSQLNSFVEQQRLYDKDIRDYNLNVRKQDATEKQNYVDNLIEAYKAEETARHNRVGEQTDIYEAETGRQNAQSSSMNAYTNRMEIPIKQEQLKINQAEQQRKQQLLPYQQANYAGQAVMNAGMSGLTMDQFLNSNQSIMSQVFPGTQQGSNQQQQYKNFNLGQ